MKQKDFTVKDYLENEKRNDHTENAVALVEKFGTPSEIKEIHEIAQRHEESNRGILYPDYKRRYEISSKYYKNLVQEEQNVSI